MLTWTFRYLGQRNYFSRKVWETMDPALIRRFVKTVILTNIFSWTFVLLCFGKLIEFFITAALRYVQNTRVIKCNGFRNLLQKLYHCLCKLSLLVESHSVTCITWFLKKKISRPFFFLYRSIVGFCVYVGHIFWL